MTKKNQAAVALGKRTSAKKALSSAKNARRATKARLAAQTPEDRAAQARRAAVARWGKKR